MENKFQQLDNESLVSFDLCILKVNKLLESTSQYIGNEGWKTVRNNLNSAGSGLIPSTNNNQLFIEGIDCEVLNPGKTWQKGKVKLKMILEFQADEPEIEATQENTGSESSLDEIRRKLDGITS
jgi:hypothetical protein